MDVQSLSYARMIRIGWDSHDEEVSNRWCGRYFKIGCSGSVVTAFVGWFYGGGNGGKYKRSPRFVIQIAQKEGKDVLALSSTGWHDSGDGWMNKELPGDLSDMESVARQFKNEMKLLCVEDK